MTIRDHISSFYSLFRDYFVYRGDPVRHKTYALAVRTLDKEQIHGAFAEVGVYRGNSSAIIHALAPHRDYHLFDTFDGFPDKEDTRFQDTSLEAVKRKICNLDHVIFHKGTFPETVAGIESESFAFVLLDMDKYESTMEGLKFFYPRLSRGGYLFVHDYNSTESNSGCKRAVDQFMQNKSELIVEIPDRCGSIVIRRS